MERGMLCSMRGIETVPHLRNVEAEIQPGTPAQAFFLRSRPVHNPTAWI
jgi:hypothetical protein